MTNNRQSLSNIQLELMKLYSTNLTEAEINELKGVLAKFYAEKSIAGANKIWDEKGLSDADMDNWLNTKS
jgi:hypothetical protein